MIKCKTVILLISPTVLEKVKTSRVGAVSGKWILSWILKAECTLIEKEGIPAMRMTLVKEVCTQEKLETNYWSGWAGLLQVSSRSSKLKTCLWVSNRTILNKAAVLLWNKTSRGQFSKVSHPDWKTNHPLFGIMLQAVWASSRLPGQNLAEKKAGR